MKKNIKAGKQIFKTLSLFLSVLPALFGQDKLSFQQISIPEGLSNPSVFSIAQDNEGFMWLATGDGLHRYDGYDFRIYKNDPVKQKFPSDRDEYKRQLESMGVMIQEGVWLQMQKDGSPFFMVTDWNKKNIDTVLEHLKNSSSVTWHNIPIRDRKKAAIATLGNWQRVCFNNGMKLDEPFLYY